MSKLLSKSALKGLNRIGDIIVPKNGDLPGFSEVGGTKYVDDMLKYAYPDDLNDLGMALSVLSFMPTFVIQWVVNKMQQSPSSNGPLSPLFRQMDLGVRGLVMSCYYTDKIPEEYSGDRPLDIIGCEIKRVED